jgi:hypothetical protein
MYWREDRDKEIETLKTAIMGKAFKKEKILLCGKPPSIRFYEITPNRPFLTWSDLISPESFAYRIAEKIWKHQQHTREDEKKDLLSEARKENDRRLLEIKDYLSAKPFTKTAIKKVMKILAEDSKRQFNPKNYHEDVKGFLQFNPLAQAWIERENSLISNIRALYDRYTPISKNEYQIAYSMAKIFEVSKLWTGKKNHFETMRKRFQEIDSPKKTFPTTNTLPA